MAANRVMLRLLSLLFAVALVSWVGFDWTLNMVGAIVFALVLPGVLLARLLGLGRRDGLTFTVAALSLSAVSMVLIGLGLNVVHMLDQAGWFKALVALNGVLALCVLLKAVIGAGRPAGSVGGGERPPAARVGAGQLACVAVALAMAVGAIAVARQGASEHRQFKFTNFWLLPVEGETDVFTIGVANREQRGMTYTLQIMTDGIVFRTVEGLQLDDGATWTENLSIIPQDSSKGAIEAWLFRSDQPDVVYRRVNVSAPRPGAGAALAAH